MLAAASRDRRARQRIPPASPACRTRCRRLGLAFVPLLNAVLPQPSIKSTSWYPADFGGLHAVPVARFQRVEDALAFVAAVLGDGALARRRLADTDAATRGAHRVAGSGGFEFRDPAVGELEVFGDELGLLAHDPGVE